MLHFPWTRASARRLAAFGAMLLALCPATSWARPHHVRLANGIEAVVHGPEDILESMTLRAGGDLRFVVDARLQYRLVADIDDPVIVNKGDGRFHAMEVDAVLRALESIEYPDVNLRFQVFVLPYPRREVLDSSARECMIFLSPGVRPVSEYAVHFTVTHEVGHVFQYRWMPDVDEAAWASYARLRGIDDGTVFSASSPHAYRPHEVFAEDFRYLFGGERANYSGGIENENLALPDEVAGLRELLLTLAEGRSLALPAARLVPTPNPFHPHTEIRVLFAADRPLAPARLGVYDAQGRMVRRLFDGKPAGRTLQLAWDGRQEDGVQVASGIYFARLEYEGDMVTSKLLLMK